MPRRSHAPTSREIMPNEAVITKPIPFPSLIGTDDIKPRRLPWYIRLGIWAGTLMVKPEHPKGWSFNPSVVTLLLIVISMVAAGAYYMGQRDNESRSVQERLQKAEQDAAEAKKLAAYQAGVADVHKAQDESEKKKPKSGQ